MLGRGCGARRARQLTGFERFRIRDALQHWRSSSGDEDALAKLETYIVDAVRGQIREKRVTFAEWDEFVVVDGNKRVIALYQAGRAEDFPLDAFLLRAE